MNKEEKLTIVKLAIEAVETCDFGKLFSFISLVMESRLLENVKAVAIVERQGDISSSGSK